MQKGRITLTQSFQEKCPVSTCVISTRRKDSGSSDLIIFKDHFIMPSFQRPKDQIWLMFMLESPLNTQKFKHPEVFNWTATYRSDSTVVTPYERWQYYEEGVKFKLQNRNYAANKTKKVAWFVSNCAARNERLNYAKNLRFVYIAAIGNFCKTIYISVSSLMLTYMEAVELKAVLELTETVTRN